MKKYILITAGVVTLSFLGLVGIGYSLIVSAPIEVSRQNTAPQEIETSPQLAQSPAKISISNQP